MSDLELSALETLAPYLAEAILVHRMGTWRASSELGLGQLPVVTASI